MSEKKERIWYWDILRIAAVICLVLRHISTASFDFVEPLGSKWWVFNAYGSLVAWMVPVYLMLSGAVFLDPDKTISIRKLYTKNIMRMLIAFFCWSALYVGYNILSGQDYNQTIPEMLFSGQFHLWFLPMIIGIYILVPVFRLATKSFHVAAYVFAASLVICVLIPTLQDIGWFPGQELFTGSNNVGFISAHVCFFFGGYIFHKYDMPRNQRIILYILAVLATIGVFAGTWRLTCREMVHNEDMQSDTNILTGIQGIALFVFVKEWSKKRTFSEETQKALRFYSNLTFGVYLVHVMLIALLDRLGFSPLTYNAGWMIPLTFLLVTPLSFLLTWLIRKIPAIGKYIT